METGWNESEEKNGTWSWTRSWSRNPTEDFEHLFLRPAVGRRWPPPCPARGRKDQLSIILHLNFIIISCSSTFTLSVSVNAVNTVIRSKEVLRRNAIPITPGIFENCIFWVALFGDGQEHEIEYCRPITWRRDISRDECWSASRRTLPVPTLPIVPIPRKTFSNPHQSRFGNIVVTSTFL